MISVAIDGPSGAGKSTIAKAVAKDLGYLYIDTGALYRSIGLYALRAGVVPTDREAVEKLLPEISLTLRHVDGVQRVFLNGEDVSEAIRTPDAAKAASGVSAHPGVRAFLLETQRSIARIHDVLMDGRDIGTVVLPDAAVKIFLTASAEKRAERRFKEYREKGVDTTYETVLRDVEKRDYDDSHREIAPLKKAEDAVLLDTSEMTLEESEEAVKRIILAARDGQKE